uniref:BRX domain-containing protein n=1 Tax=Fagus sylvatica TaxID=28930 RepID=A0A2N9FN83_FAGSY
MTGNLWSNGLGWGLAFLNLMCSKKSLKASKAPNPNKPYRVCDNCFNKVWKAIESDGSSQSLESLKQVESRSSKKNKKLEFNSSRVSPVPNAGKFVVDDSKRKNDSLCQEVMNLRAQVETLTRKAQLQEIELERTTKQLKEAISIAGEETERCKAAKEVIRSLIAQNVELEVATPPCSSLSSNFCKVLKKWELQMYLEFCIIRYELVCSALVFSLDTDGILNALLSLIKFQVFIFYTLKDMAERLPVVAVRNIKSPSLSSFGSSPASNEVSNASIDRMNGQAVFQDQDSNGSSNQLLSNGSTTNSNRNSGHNKQAHLDATTRNGGRTKESESLLDNERVEQDEPGPGVYITLTSLPGGVKDLKRVRFSRKRFSEKQAEQWWAENRARVYERYNVRMNDKSNVGVGSEDLSH